MMIFSIPGNEVQRTVLVLMLCVPALTTAQTGQALIGNPLLSPSKIKEVKRQIAEAGKEPVPLPPQSPVPPAMLPPSQPSPVGMVGGMLPSIPTEDKARQVLSRVQVMAIAGQTALLATQASPFGNGVSHIGAPHMQMPHMQAPQMQMPQMPQMQMPGFPSGTALQQGQQTSQGSQYVRRTSSVLVRHGETTFVEGFEVVPFVRGESVRLVLAAMPKEIVFQGAIQPSLYSPSSAVATNDLQKQSSEYVNLAKPDPTSMTGSATPPAAAQPPTQLPMQPAQAPVQQR